MIHEFFKADESPLTKKEIEYILIALNELRTEALGYRVLYPTCGMCHNLNKKLKEIYHWFFLFQEFFPELLLTDCVYPFRRIDSGNEWDSQWRGEGLEARLELLDWLIWRFDGELTALDNTVASMEAK